jgi:hypothetical protein
MLIALVTTVSNVMPIAAYIHRQGTLRMAKGRGSTKRKSIVCKSADDPLR